MILKALFLILIQLPDKNSLIENTSLDIFNDKELREVMEVFNINSFPTNFGGGFDANYLSFLTFKDNNVCITVFLKEIISPNPFNEEMFELSGSEKIEQFETLKNALVRSVSVTLFSDMKNCQDRSVCQRFKVLRKKSTGFVYSRLKDPNREYLLLNHGRVLRFWDHNGDIVEIHPSVKDLERLKKSGTLAEILRCKWRLIRIFAGSSQPGLDAIRILPGCM